MKSRTMSSRSIGVNQEGSALIIAILAMLLIGVIGVSFALLANLETRIGINHKQAAQALALAEAGLEHARNEVRTRMGSGLDFSAANLVGNASNGSLLFGTDQALGAGQYNARIDNDCGSTLVPATMTQDTGCATNKDNNEQAILTAWGYVNSPTTGARVAGARIRAWIQTSNPWKHVCYNGDGTLCTQEAPANPNAPVNPSDPDNLNGPATGSLPVPNNLPCGTAVRHTAQVSFGASDCVINPYYDSALNTPCPQCSPARLGCSGHLGTGTDLCPDSGMVFYGCSGPTCTGSPLLHNANITISNTGGAVFRCAGDHIGGNHPGCAATPHTNSGVVVYVMGKVSVANGGEVNGTVVVHGDGNGGTSGPAVDVGLSGTSGLWSISGCTTCGYPLALLIYDPRQATLPQNTDANLSNGTSEIHGIVYSAGTVSFNPITVDGSVMAWTSYFGNAQSGATYNPTYGNGAPPPGFSSGGGGQTVAILRRTWSQCTNYSTTEATAPTPCN